MLISYCGEIKTFYCILLSALSIKLTIKNWKKYTICWLQNFLTVKNLVQLSDRPTVYEVSKNNVFVLPVNPIRSCELNLSLAVMSGASNITSLRPIWSRQLRHIQKQIFSTNTAMCKTCNHL